jgi:hypothetical protein
LLDKYAHARKWLKLFSELPPCDMVKYYNLLIFPWVYLHKHACNIMSYFHLVCGSWARSYGLESRDIVDMKK